MIVEKQTIIELLSGTLSEEKRKTLEERVQLNHYIVLHSHRHGTDIVSVETDQKILNGSDMKRLLIAADSDRFEFHVKDDEFLEAWDEAESLLDANTGFCNLELPSDEELVLNLGGIQHLVEDL